MGTLPRLLVQYDHRRLLFPRYRDRCCDRRRGRQPPKDHARSDPTCVLASVDVLRLGCTFKLPRVVSALTSCSQIWVISVLVPYDDPRLLSGGGDARASPFVIAIDNAGIKGLPHVVNAVLLVAAWSAGNSDLVSTQGR
jgi:hypothetical protein